MGPVFSYAPADHKWGGCWGGQLNPGYGPVWLAELVSLPALLHSHPQGELSSTSLARSHVTQEARKRPSSLKPLKLAHLQPHHRPFLLLPR